MPRKCHGAAVLDGKLYVVGGSDQQMSVLSAECLDLTLPEDQVTRVDNNTNNNTIHQWSWRPLAPLPSWHNGNPAPVLGSTLYLPVAYGSDTDKRYQPARDVWEAWEGTGTPRYIYTILYHHTQYFIHNARILQVDNFTLNVST